jgi:hypothetical protein
MSKLADQLVLADRLLLMMMMVVVVWRANRTEIELVSKSIIN